MFCEGCRRSVIHIPHEREGGLALAGPIFEDSKLQFVLVKRGRARVRAVGGGFVEQPGIGQAHRLDDVRGRSIQIVRAHQAGHARHPANGDAVGIAPEVVIPPGRFDPGPVAAGTGEPAVGPGDPGRAHLHLGEAGEQLRVVGGRWHLRERRRVPGAAHHGEPLMALLPCLADAPAHVGFPPRPERVLLSRHLRAQRRHRLADAGKEVIAIQALLHHVFPPALAVTIACRRRQPAQRILAHHLRGLGRGYRIALILDRFGSGSPRILPHRELVRLRQVDNARGNAACEAIPERLPLGREEGKGIRYGAAGLLRHVEEKCHRRLHLGVGQERQHLLGIRWPLDQDDIRLQCLQRLQDAPRRPGAVVAYAEHVGDWFGHWHLLHQASFVTRC